MNLTERLKNYLTNLEAGGTSPHVSWYIEFQMSKYKDWTACVMLSAPLIPTTKKIPGFPDFQLSNMPISPINPENRESTVQCVENNVNMKNVFINETVQFQYLQAKQVEDDSREAI